MRGQLANAAVDMAVEQAVNWLALVGERPAKRWCFSTPTRTDSSLPGWLGHCRTWRGGASLCGRVVVGVRVCRCVGSVYNVRLHARSRGKTTGPSTPFNMLPFSPPWRRTGRRRRNPNAWILSKTRPGDVLPTFYQGEKVSSRRPFQRGSRETEGMLHAE